MNFDPRLTDAEYSQLAPHPTDRQSYRTGAWRRILVATGGFWTVVTIVAWKVWSGS